MERTATPGVYRRGARYVVVYRDPAGKQRKRSARTYDDARLLKVTIMASVAHGEYRTPSVVTFAEYLAAWRKTYEGRISRGVRPRTLARYERQLDVHAVPFFGSRRLVEIGPVDVKRFIRQVQATGVKPATVRRILAPLRVLFATAVEDGALRTNPTLGVRVTAPATIDDAPKAADRRALTDAELGALLRELPERHRLLVVFLARTGLRISEAAGLAWRHVDHGALRVAIRRGYYAGGYSPPKSQHGRRDVRIDAELARALWAARAASPFRGDDDPVFASSRGTPVDRDHLRARVLTPAARRAGVPWAGWHTLRHTCASKLFAEGRNAKQVQKVLGHHSPAFTMATYVHLQADDLPEPPRYDLGDQGGNRMATEATGTSRNEDTAETA